jgi:hypothetical protein
MSLTSETNVIKMIPVIQRRIVNTTIDIINAILENSYGDKVSYIFEIFRIRFNVKMNTIFNNNNYYNLLLQQSKFKYATARRREHLVLVPDDKIPSFVYNPVNWRTIYPQRFFLPYLKRNTIDIENVSNLTHCNDGNFHMWKFKKNNGFVCSICNVKIDELKYDKKESKVILEKYINLQLNILAQNICLIDNDNHTYIYDEKTKHNICKKCKKQDIHIYSISDLQKLKKSIYNTDRHDRYIKSNELYIRKKDANTDYIKKIVNKTIEHMKLNINYIHTFVDKLKGLVGEVIKGTQLTYIKNNKYHIDHDSDGYDLGGNDIVITDDNTITYKKNHNYFKKDVIYYTDNRGRRKDVYYDAISKYLIGYKELSGKYIDIKNTNKKIKITLSIYNKLNILGYSSEYINIKNNNKQDNHMLKDICSSRLENLKRTVIEFQRVFNNILNNKDVSKGKNDNKNISEHNYFSNKLNTIIDKYKNRFSNIKLTNKKGTGKIFKHWKAISNGLVISNFENNNIDNESQYINATEINRYDETSNIMLFYIIEQFTNLLDYNENSFIKTNIANFIIEFIDSVYNRYNNEYIYLNSDIIKFIYTLNSHGYLKDFYDNKTIDIQDDNDKLTEEEIENNLDIKESLDAIDVDMSVEDMEENMSSMYDKLSEQY